MAIIPAAWKKRLHITSGAWKESYPNISVLPSLSKGRELVGKDKSTGVWGYGEKAKKRRGLGKDEMNPPHHL